MAGINPTQRVAAWNVEFVDNSDKSFAGLFQAKDMVTYGDAFDELKLCFQLDDHDALALWQISPGPGQTYDDVCIHAAAPTHFLGRSLYLRSTSSKTRYLVLNHYTEKCDRASMLDVSDHIAGNCASPISTPVRRQHPTYRPINKASDDPYLPNTPKRGSRNTSPTKRSPVKRSATTSEVSSTNLDDSIESFIHKQDAQRAIANFRNAAETRGSSCAISGVGEGWVNGMVVGPGIHACHIVPQSAWDLYPLPEDEDNEDSSLNSPRRWQKKWENTWAGENALWLQSSVHDAHDGRILAIHPKTWKIRSFTPYNLILPYHNTVAHLSPDYPPDHRALRYQWESCVIENMTAKNPWRTPVVPMTSPSELDSEPIDTDRHSSPSKRQRTLNATIVPEDQALDASNIAESSTQLQKRDAFAGDNNCSSPSNQSLPELTSETTDESSDSESIEKQESSRKRRLSIDEDYAVHNTSHITPQNSQYFLSDVNWELKRQKHG